MTYQPTHPAALRILDKVNDRDSAEARNPEMLADAIRSAIERSHMLDTEGVRQALLTLACPETCRGAVSHDGWHRLCETKAAAALNLLSVA